MFYLNEQWKEQNLDLIFTISSEEFKWFNYSITGVVEH